MESLNHVQYHEVPRPRVLDDFDLDFYVENVIPQDHTKDFVMDIFNSNVLNTGATLDLKNALAATTWTGSASTVSNYLTVNNTASGATIAISATSGGPGTAIASMAGATGLNLTTVLAHAIV